MHQVAYTCVKVAFENKRIAAQRAVEINAENSVKKMGYTFSAYRWPVCLKYLLSKMDRTLARWINDISY